MGIGMNYLSLPAYHWHVSDAPGMTDRALDSLLKVLKRPEFHVHNVVPASATQRDMDDAWGNGASFTAYSEAGGDKYHLHTVRDALLPWLIARGNWAKMKFDPDNSGAISKPRSSRNFKVLHERLLAVFPTAKLIAFILWYDASLLLLTSQAEFVPLVLQIGNLDRADRVAPINFLLLGWLGRACNPRYAVRRILEEISDFRSSLLSFGFAKAGPGVLQLKLAIMANKGDYLAMAKLGSTSEAINGCHPCRHCVMPGTKKANPEAWLNCVQRTCAAAFAAQGNMNYNDHTSRDEAAPLWCVPSGSIELYTLFAEDKGHSRDKGMSGFLCRHAFRFAAAARGGEAEIAKRIKGMPSPLHSHLGDYSGDEDSNAVFAAVSGPALSVTRHGARVTRDFDLSGNGSLCHEPGYAKGKCQYADKVMEMWLPK
jgi:hypothetical protein